MSFQSSNCPSAADLKRQPRRIIAGMAARRDGIAALVQTFAPILARPYGKAIFMTEAPTPPDYRRIVSRSFCV
jgi:hypothetical protein